MHRLCLILTTTALLAQTGETKVIRTGALTFEHTTLFKETVTQNPTLEIFLSRVRGKVFIRGAKTSTLQVRERMTIKAHSEKEAKGLARQYQLMVNHPKDNTFDFKGHKRSPMALRFIYELDVPSNAQLNVETSGGNIRIQNIQGVLTLDTSGGDIDLNHVVGVVNGKTSGGNLEAYDYEGVLTLTTSGGNIRIRNGSGPATVSTSGGDIILSQITGNIQMETSGGSLWCENITGQSITGETSGGNIRLETIRGDVNVSTSGGHVELWDIRGIVSASTSGGSIQAQNIQGPLTVSAIGGSITGKHVSAGVKASTIGGNIHIEKDWNSQWKDQTIQLENSDGNIYLSIPSDFPATIEATIKGQRIPNGIISDIPLILEYNTRYLSGKGSMNQGTYLITLKTTNGQIIIEEER